MADLVDNYPAQDSLDGPSVRWKEATPHDTNQLDVWPKWVEAGSTGGALIAVDKDGNTITHTFTAGEIKKIRPVIIKATGTVVSPVIVHY